MEVNKARQLVMVAILVGVALMFTGGKDAWLVGGIYEHATVFTVDNSGPNDIYIGLSYKSYEPPVPMDVAVKTSLTGGTLCTGSVSPSLLQAYPDHTDVRIISSCNLDAGIEYYVIIGAVASTSITTGYIPQQTTSIAGYTRCNDASSAFCGTTAWQTALEGGAVLYSLPSGGGTPGGCNTDADTNCDGCVHDTEFPLAVNSWKAQTGISDSEFPNVVNNWKSQTGC